MKAETHVRKSHFLGTKLRALRKRNGLTLEELSTRCIQLDSAGAPSVSYLSMIESGKRVPSSDVLQLLSSVFHASEKVHDPDRAVIGRRVTLLEEDGDSTTYALVFPGDGDPGQGWISADSPLGTAVMGCGPGERVEVIAPAGRWLVTVLAVE